MDFYEAPERKCLPSRGRVPRREKGLAAAVLRTGGLEDLALTSRERHGMPTQVAEPITSDLLVGEFGEAQP